MPWGSLADRLRAPVHLTHGAAPHLLFPLVAWATLHSLFLGFKFFLIENIVKYLIVFKNIVVIF